ncbi:MAG: NifU family protein [Actinomycetota bacterium]|nr:NifU family protein [Acidimicrobiia bacterium]MDQ3293088.1 NifU family protein [Actinomycetota bacterium]
MGDDDDLLPYGEALERIASLAEALTAHPDREVSEQVTELLDWVDAFHRDGLGRLVEMIRSWRGEIFLESVGQDEVVGTLLAAYGLGEDAEAAAEAEAAVAAALESVRPLVESHGGSIEVEDITDGVVRVRMKGTCDGCPSSQDTLTYGVEVALRDGWGNFRRLELVEPAAAIDAEKAALECVTVPEGAHRPAPIPVPEPPLLQIRGHEQS